VVEEGARDVTALVGLPSSVEDQIDRGIEATQCPSETCNLLPPTIKVALDDDKIQFASAITVLPVTRTKENNFCTGRSFGQPTNYLLE
jgi:hypothetical protein